MAPPGPTHGFAGDQRGDGDESRVRQHEQTTVLQLGEHLSEALAKARSNEGSFYCVPNMGFIGSKLPGSAGAPILSCTISAASRAEAW